MAEPALRIPIRQPLMAVLAAVCAGIVLDRYLAWPVGVWWSAAAAGWLAWCWLWRLKRDAAAIVPLLISLAATGAAWHHCRWSLFEANQLALAARNDAAPVALEVIALSGPRRVPSPPPNPLRTLATPERTRIAVEVQAVRDGEHWRPAAGWTTLSVNGRVIDVRPGDRLRVYGQFAAVRPPANPGEFDYRRQARAGRRLCWLSAEFPECVARETRAALTVPSRLVDFLRTRGDALLWRNLGPRRSGLAAAMFLGARGELDPELQQAFVETGTIHLLVVSGLNVGILAGCLLWVLRKALVPRSWALAIVAVACVLYAATTDGEPPVVRATVMVLVGCLAVALGRRAIGFNSLAAAGLVVLAINPAELFQAGTQLSFLSVGVLVFLAERRAARPRLDPLDRLIFRTHPWHERVFRRQAGNVGTLCLTSLVIWLVIAPLVMTRFHIVSPAAVLLGPVLAVPVMLAMAGGFVVFAFGWLLPPVGALAGTVCDWNLAFMQFAVERVRDLPLAHFWTSGPADWWLAGFYLFAMVYALVPAWRPPVRWCGGILAGWVAAGLLVSVATRPSGEELRCTFLSVGHGAAVVVELPGGQTLLYDAGRLGAPETASRAVASYLWSRGIRRLDAIVVSHADADHYNAVPALLDQFSTGAVYVSPVMFEGSGQALAALRAALTDSGVPMATVHSGDRLRTASQARIAVLHPPRTGVLGSDNANSIVLAIEWQGRRILLTGDLESPGLDDVLAELPYDCDVTMAPHHGSAASNPPGFAAWCTPEWTIVSGGSSDRLSAIEAAYTQRGGRVLHTADVGAVTISISAGQVTVDSWHGAD